MKISSQLLAYSFAFSVVFSVFKDEIHGLCFRCLLIEKLRCRSWFVVINSLFLLAGIATAEGKSAEARKINRRGGPAKNRRENRRKECQRVRQVRHNKERFGCCRDCSHGQSQWYNLETIHPSRNARGDGSYDISGPQHAKISICLHRAAPLNIYFLRWNQLRNGFRDFLRLEANGRTQFAMFSWIKVRYGVRVWGYTKLFFLRLSLPEGIAQKK